MDVNGLVDKINAWYPIVVAVGGSILVIILAYRGYQWGSASDPQEEKQAQKSVLNVVKGGGIMICAAVIWGFIKSTFGG